MINRELTKLFTVKKPVDTFMEELRESIIQATGILTNMIDTLNNAYDINDEDRVKAYNTFIQSTTAAGIFMIDFETGIFMIDFEKRAYETLQDYLGVDIDDSK